MVGTVRPAEPESDNTDGGRERPLYRAQTPQSGGTRYDDIFGMNYPAWICMAIGIYSVAGVLAGCASLIFGWI